ncbi:relaxase/mobilization nuclease domain-containing protein [Streptomyces silvisoli]|uniref:Relaxase/mobilization nuclease domain-containing protein n=1 Tax=Streptomyces silvisoli TaxID=3034235 RepID=A0ABT5ZR30_9ACTN|nr:relaxase/mobilization nuclease domain-containing protein [Streptomyces silvisoli]MDF3292279.1 relaxase/mobilization nuclease domain-containing protein [Streptomyces silvisoli]
MIAAIKKPGSNTRGLLAYLYGPGRHDEHHDPHIVAAFATLGMPDPGRDEAATLTELARYLDEPVRLRNSEAGKQLTDHVWHCPVRAAPEDRYLSDAEWAEIAERIVQTTGIAPEGDDLACRWIAVRHADDHIHILATTVREDGRRPKLHNSGVRAGEECRQIEKHYGLRQLNPGDGTATRRPTQGEMHKAERLGWEQTSREWLQDRIRAAIPHAATVEELLAYLEADGVEVKARRGPSGDLLGYAVGRPGDVNDNGQQIYHPGGKIAPDLSLPKLRDRLATTPPEEYPTAHRNRPSTPWQRATETLDTLTIHLTDTDDGGGDATAQAHIAALGELIEATAQTAPNHVRAELQAATRAFARAQRSQIRAENAAAASLRTAARDIVYAGTGKDGSALAVLLEAMIWSVVLAERWHQARSHAQQSAAAHQAVQHLQTAYDQATAEQLAELTRRQPRQETRNTLAADVKAAVPEHAARILADPNWPALATVLADAEAGGHKPHQLLNEAASQRELDTARLPARVLLTRIQHTARNPVPNRRAEAARLRSTLAVGVPAQHVQTPWPPAATTPTGQQNRQRR